MPVTCIYMYVHCKCVLQLTRICCVQYMTHPLRVLLYLEGMGGGARVKGMGGGARVKGMGGGARVKVDIGLILRRHSHSSIITCFVCAVFLRTSMCSSTML